jgi:cobalamin biosynthesis protein CobD/CbiB
MTMPVWITHLKRPGSLWGAVVGWVCVCLGVLGLVLPVAPGLPFLIAGLFILSARYTWAAVCLHWVKRQAKKVSGEKSRGKRAASELVTDDPR